MSAAASAEMIETPPVLNFEEIDYKEIEVEEVSEGSGDLRTQPPRLAGRGLPEGPARPRAAPAGPRRVAFPSALPTLREESRRLPGCAGVPAPTHPHTPPAAPGCCPGVPASPLRAAAVGIGKQRRCGWERRC